MGQIYSGKSYFTHLGFTAIYKYISKCLLSRSEMNLRVSLDEDTNTAVRRHTVRSAGL